MKIGISSSTQPLIFISLSTCMAYGFKFYSHRLLQQQGVIINIYVLQASRLKLVLGNQHELSFDVTYSFQLRRGCIA